ncbi:MAG: hypothetical protein WCT15_02490 [Candidatus Omnitrophota bacterium]
MKFNFQATGIGSVPFKDPKQACRVIFNNFESIPFWPQLPKRSFLESMYVQYSESLPGLVIDDKDKTIHIDSSRAISDIETVYGKYLERDIDFFKISEDHAEGFYEFLASAPSSCKSAEFVKGHITGPISFALSVTDENKVSIIYNKDVFEVLVKVLSMKAAWQIRRLKAINPNVIIFIDEPYLVSIGSSYVNIDVKDAMEKLDEVIAAVKAEGALAGVHCCGNTDWPLMLKRDMDILNFDAYNFTKEFSLYSAELSLFLKRGGSIAWGVLPSSDAADNETADSLKKRLNGYLDIFAGKGIDRSDISSMITPSCGVGTLDEARAEKIFGFAKELSGKF